jgi:putative transposase
VLTVADEGVLVGPRIVIRDRDAKWSAPVRQLLNESGIRVGQTPYQAPTAHAYAERFVRSVRDDCLDRVIPFGERHLRRRLAECIAHDPRERIIRGWRTRSSRRGVRGGRVAGFTAARVSGGSSLMTTARPDRARRSPQPFGPAVGHYGTI